MKLLQHWEFSICISLIGVGSTLAQREPFSAFGDEIRVEPAQAPGPGPGPAPGPISPPLIQIGTGRELVFTSQSCNAQMQSQIRNVCARDLDSYGVFSNGSGGKSIVPNAMTWDSLRRRSRHLFQQICMAFENWDRCVGPYKPYCFYTEPIKGRFAVAHEALAYVCRPPAYSDMLNNWECLLQASSRSDLIMCETQIMADYGSDNSAPMRMNLRDGDVACRVLQDYVSCIKKPIWDQCGPSAWGHVREAFQRPTQVYLPYCMMSAGTSVDPVIEVIVLAMTALLLLL